MIISGKDLLSSVIPYVHILSSSFNGTYCSQCFQCSNDVKRCSKCNRIAYCSIGCQRKDWIYHKHECEYFDDLDEEFDLIRLYLRFILRYENDRGIENSSTKRTVDDLFSHEKEIRQDRRRARTFQSIDRWFKKSNFNSKLDETKLFDLFCRLVINTLTIHDPIDLKPIGYGLYLDGTIYNHSCMPTCHTVFNGIYLSVRTIIDHSNDQSTINYVDLLENREIRQKNLFENYYFHCQCARCSNLNSQENILLEKIHHEEQKMDQLIDEKNFSKAYQTSQQLCDDYELILPVYHAYVSLHHVKHLKLALFLAETIDSATLETMMNVARRRLKISMGDQHPLTQETVQLCEQYRLELTFQQRQLMG